MLSCEIMLRVLTFFLAERRQDVSCENMLRVLTFLHCGETGNCFHMRRCLGSSLFCFAGRLQNVRVGFVRFLIRQESFHVTTCLGSSLCCFAGRRQNVERIMKVLF